MRLIDADDFFARMENDTDLCAEMETDGLKALKRYLDMQPTAYDVDKVVAELEEMIHPKQLYFCKYARGGCKHLYNNDKDCMECIVENAIEIVKQGGVADDVCEWKGKEKEFIQNPHTKRLYSNEPSMKNVYCNTCGKKIKVVEYMDEDELRYCHHDDTDEYHDCLDYMECEECPYYYEDLD